MQSQAVKILKNNKKQLSELWSSKLSESGSFANFTSNEENESGEFTDLFIQALSDNSINDPSSYEFEKVNESLVGISISRGKRGFTPKENAMYLFAFKEALLEILSSNITEPAALYEDNLRLSNIVDNMTILTYEAYMKGREDVILRQNDEMAEISTPVIKVWDGIVALPIIGTLDSSRTQVVMENLLQQIVDTGSSIAILDISGVPAVDSLVAQHLIKTVSATRLMGAECIISGIRPEIAQTVVHLGIDLSNIITKASLASALQTAFTMLQLEVVKKKNSI